jgi:hypothetical protein
MMRRAIGLSLVGLGTFLIVIAVVLPTYLTGQFKKFPLNTYQVDTLVATNASYFNIPTMTERSGVTIQATDTTKGLATQGNSSTAVWQNFTYMYDLTNHNRVLYQKRTAAFDRKTAQLVQCCGENPAGQSGIVGYVFPFGAQKQTYNMWDPATLKPEPYAYSGTTSIQGIQVYEYTANIAPTQIGTESVPGAMVNSSASTVTAREMYSATATYFVDPETGAPIDAHEHEIIQFYNGNTPALTYLNANLIMTLASVTHLVGVDSNGRNELTLVSLILPIVIGVVGAIALVAGILMVRRPREDVEAGPTTPAPERAAVPETSGPDLTSVHLVPEAAAAEAATAGTASATPEATAEAEEAPATEAAPVAEAAAPTEATAPTEAAAGAEATAPTEATAPAEVAAPTEATAPAEVAAPAQAAAPAEAASPAETAAEANGNAAAATVPRRARRTSNSAADPDTGAK